jgi:hypothetical protein
VWQSIIRLIAFYRREAVNATFGEDPSLWRVTKPCPETFGIACL